MLRAVLLTLFPALLLAQADYFPPADLPNDSDLPNIVLITGDHLRWDHIAANGNPALITPNIDAVVREGATFLHHYTVGVACTPNRASLMTGRYPNAHGLISNGIMLPDDEVTLTHVLRAAGYYTGQMGKLHFMPHKDRDHREPYKPYGFHQMRLSDEPGCYDDAFGRWLWAQGPDVREAARVTMPGERKALDYYTFEGTDDTTHASWAATETITFIEDTTQRFPGRSFFVHTGFYAPHPPLNPPASALRQYDGRALPPRHEAPDELDHMPLKFARAMANRHERLGVMTEAVWDEYRRHFYAMVTHLDENVGRIIAALKASGRWESTIFVLTSDHGDYLGDHGINSKSALPYDGSMRIPLVLAGPGIPRGIRIEEMAEIVDVMPTLLEILGLEQTAGNQGISLVGVLNGEKGKTEIYQQGVTNRIIRTKEATYAVDTNGEEILFDLRKDPHQLRNVSVQADAKPLLDEMRMALIQKIMATRDPLPPRIRPY